MNSEMNIAFLGGYEIAVVFQPDERLQCVNKSTMSLTRHVQAFATKLLTNFSSNWL
jgi:hypothetical protein